MSFSPLHLDRELIDSGMSVSEAFKQQSKDLSAASVDMARDLLNTISSGKNHEYQEAAFYSSLRDIVDLLTENLAMMALAVTDVDAEPDKQDSLWCTVVASVRESTMEYMDILSTTITGINTAMIAADYIDAMNGYDAELGEGDSDE